MVREKFLTENKGKLIRLIFKNGFQLRGKLIDFDESDMLIETVTYNSDPIVVSYSGITTFIPGGN